MNYIKVYCIFYQLITNLFAISAHACACFSREHCDLRWFNALSSKNLIAYMRLLFPECAELLWSRISSVTCAVRVTCAAVLTAPCGYILCSFGLVLNIPRLADRPILHDLTLSIICNATAITRASRCNLYILSSLKTILWQGLSLGGSRGTTGAASAFQTQWACLILAISDASEQLSFRRALGHFQKAHPFTRWAASVPLTRTIL